MRLSGKTPLPPQMEHGNGNPGWGIAGYRFPSIQFGHFMPHPSSSPQTPAPDSCRTRPASIVLFPALSVLFRAPIAIDAHGAHAISLMLADERPTAAQAGDTDAFPTFPRLSGPLVSYTLRPSSIPCPRRQTHIGVESVLPRHFLSTATGAKSHFMNLPV